MQQGDLTVVRHQTGVLVSTLPQAFQETAALRPDAVAIRTVGDKVVITGLTNASHIGEVVELGGKVIHLSLLKRAV